MSEVSEVWNQHWLPDIDEKDLCLPWQGQRPSDALSFINFKSEKNVSLSKKHNPHNTWITKAFEIHSK